MRRWAAVVLGLLIPVATAHAQHEHHPSAPDTTRSSPAHLHAATAKPLPPKKSQPMQHDPHAGMDPAMHATVVHVMPAAFGPYPMTREASGTAWQPDATPHEGLHGMRGSWMWMAHGFANVVWNEQRGPRGGDEGMSTSMLMGMASRPAGAGRFGVRAMLSAEPATLGSDGYALLLQTGETADGVHELIDRQHPHDLFMELSASWAVSDATRSLFVYFGFPGEPALGPPTFMHRYSGVELPDSPISHHWLDSTHITFGVLTAGAVRGGLKIEGSLFTGREPDEKRYDFDEPAFDSQSLRVSWNPTRAWALQVSNGWIESPEQLHPDTDVDRTTVSAMYARASAGSQWHTTLAWGQNRNHPGHTLDAWLLESRLTLGGVHTLLARAESVEKDELFEESDPLAGRVFRVGKITAGYVADVVRGRSLALGVGITGSVIVVPDELEPAYGEHPTAALGFVRLALR